MKTTNAEGRSPQEFCLAVEAYRSARGADLHKPSNPPVGPCALVQVRSSTLVRYDGRGRIDCSVIAGETSNSVEGLAEALWPTVLRRHWLVVSLHLVAESADGQHRMDFALSRGGELDLSRLDTVMHEQLQALLSALDWFGHHAAVRRDRSRTSITPGVAGWTA